MNLFSNQTRYLLYARFSLRCLALIATVLLLFYGVPPLFRFCSPFLLGFGLSVVLNPCVLFLQRRIGFSRNIISIFLIFVLFLAVVMGIWWSITLLVKEFLTLSEQWPQFLTFFHSMSDKIQSNTAQYFQKLSPPVSAWANGLVSDCVAYLRELLPSLLGRISAYFLGYLQLFPSFLLAFFVFFMGSYFFTAQYPYLKINFISMMSDDIRYLLSQIKSTALTSFGGYLRAQLILSGGVFIITFVGFFLISQPYSLIIATFIAILDFIPLVGAGVILLPWAVIAAALGNLTLGGELFFIWCITAIFRRLAEPKILDKQTGLSPLLSLISIYVGLKLGGVVAMVLAPILVLIVLNLWNIGIFDSFRKDFRIICTDLSALLKLKINR